MTTAATGQWPGSGDHIFGGIDISAALETSGAADAVRGHLWEFTQATQNQAVKEVERMTAELADLDPVQIIAGALSTFRELREAGVRTLDEPGNAELVELIGHQVTFQHQPVIKLVVNGKQIASMQLLMSLVLDIQALTATVRAGRLTALQTGRCDATGSISIDGRTVASRTGPVMLPVSIPLGHGILLTAPARRR